MSAAATSAEIALFPLGTVLFPGGLLPLRIFEQRYLEMVSACLRGNEPFGVCLIREGKEVGAPAVPHPVGCLARIVQWDMQQLGVLNIIARGEHRFRIVERRVQPDGLARGSIELLAEEDDAAIADAADLCSRTLKAIIEQGAAPLLEAPHRLESSSWVSGRLAELLPLPLEFKQRLLEVDGGAERLRLLREALRRKL